MAYVTPTGWQCSAHSNHHNPKPLHDEETLARFQRFINHDRREPQGTEEFNQEQAALTRLKQFEANGDFTSKAYDDAKRYHEACLKSLVAAR